MQYFHDNRGHLSGRCALVTGLMLAALASPVGAEPAVNAEAADVARSLGRLDQSYRYRGLRAGHGAAATQGASYGDAPDVADRAAAQADQPLPPGMQMLDVPPAEGNGTR